jgi:hypothetical protein
LNHDLLHVDIFPSCVSSNEHAKKQPALRDMQKESTRPFLELKIFSTGTSSHRMLIMKVKSYIPQSYLTWLDVIDAAFARICDNTDLVHKIAHIQLTPQLTYNLVVSIHTFKTLIMYARTLCTRAGGISRAIHWRYRH